MKSGFSSKEYITSERTLIGNKDIRTSHVKKAGVTYELKGRLLPYHTFLTRIQGQTNVPITTLHRALCKVNETKPIKPEYFTERTVGNIVTTIHNWMNTSLQTRFNYKQTSYTPLSTGLTDSKGRVKDEVVQGNIGCFWNEGCPSEKYLYDSIVYDSDIEKDNIMLDIEEVIVFGKIPRSSISIPTISSSAYNSDFMYVVKRKNGKKELNIIVESKGVDEDINLRVEEKLKISSAEKFFDQLTLDGYEVKFKRQLNTKGVKEIISELIEV